MKPHGWSVRAAWSKALWWLALPAALAGCANTTPLLDEEFGSSLRMLRVQQTLNTDASNNRNPVAGIDGKAAKGALDNYRDSFRAPPSEAANVIQIGVGQGQAGR
jgi:hypothetical protein